MMTEATGTGPRLLDSLASATGPARGLFTHAAWPGHKVYVDSLRQGDRARWTEVMQDSTDEAGNVTQKLDRMSYTFLAAVCYDALTGGNKLMQDTDADFQKFQTLHIEPSDELFQFALAHNGMGKDSVKDEAKNS